MEHWTVAPYDELVFKAFNLENLIGEVWSSSSYNTSDVDDLVAQTSKVKLNRTGGLNSIRPHEGLVLEVDELVSPVNDVCRVREDELKFCNLAERAASTHKLSSNEISVLNVLSIV